jgi:hypothetical protein
MMGPPPDLGPPQQRPRPAPVAAVAARSSGVHSLLPSWLQDYGGRQDADLIGEAVAATQMSDGK